MDFEPIELRYVLTRRQRWVPHWKLWRGYLPIYTVLLVGATLAVRQSWWFLPVPIFLVILFRGLFVGTLNVLLVRRQAMDIRIEQNGLGFLVGGDRWWFFLDGLSAVEMLTPGVWTVRHWNGSVVNVPSELLSDSQLNFLRDWVERSKEIRRALHVPEC
jgi:hypothetical protein